MNEAAASAQTRIQTPRRPPSRRHSFQFSPRCRLITLTSLRLPLSGALIRYPLHFTPFPSPSPSVCGAPLPLPHCLSVPLIVSGFKRLYLRVSGLLVFHPGDGNLLESPYSPPKSGTFCRPQNVTREPFCLFFSAVIIFLWRGKLYSDTSAEAFGNEWNGDEVPAWCLTIRHQKRRRFKCTISPHFFTAGLLCVSPRRKRHLEGIISS